jgi:K+ potassium transporter
MTTFAAAVSTPAAAHPARAALLLGALGVVFGDIGTSAIYAFRVSLKAAGSAAAETVLGILSLVFWAACNRISGPARDCRPADRDSPQPRRRPRPRCSDCAYRRGRRASRGEFPSARRRARGSPPRSSSSARATPRRNRRRGSRQPGFFIWRLQLLGTDDVRRGLFQPPEQIGKPPVDAVDVVSRDPHRTCPNAGCKKARRPAGQLKAEDLSAPRQLSKWVKRHAEAQSRVHAGRRLAQDISATEFKRAPARSVHYRYRDREPMRNSRAPKPAPRARRRGSSRSALYVRF